jgi:hypothetical protein
MVQNFEDGRERQPSGEAKVSDVGGKKIELEIHGPNRGFSK